MLTVSFFFTLYFHFSQTSSFVYVSGLASLHPTELFPSQISSSSYCVIGVCHCGPFSISTSLLHLLLFSLSQCVLPSLPSSICLSLCSHSEGLQTHLCTLICCAIVPSTPCCQPLGPLSHWHPFIIILSSPSLPITHTHTDNHPLYQRDSEKILNSNPISVEPDFCV